MARHINRVNYLVTMIFSENIDVRTQVDTEQSFKTEIVKNLQHLVQRKEIEHFAVADDEVINEKLTTDAAPIIHAHWFSVTEPDDKGRVQYGCSHCRAFASFTYDNDQRFCGACGAKMDEGKVNNYG